MTDNKPIDHPLYLEKYIERMGTGTRDMIRLCREAVVPEPEYAVRDGFVQAMSLPDKPTSPNQKYRLAEKRRGWLPARKPEGRK